MVDLSDLTPPLKEIEPIKVELVETLDKEVEISVAKEDLVEIEEDQDLTQP